MMPLWLFTLGRNIFEGTTTTVPLHNIFGTLASMTIFLGLGLLFQKFLPKVANVSNNNFINKYEI
jgi:sodium/bile acid cotransporter 3/5